MKDLCWACRQKRHRRCVGCNCDHTEDPVKATRHAAQVIAGVVAASAVYEVDEE